MDVDLQRFDDTERADVKRPDLVPSPFDLVYTFVSCPSFATKALMTGSCADYDESRNWDPRALSEIPEAQVFTPTIEEFKGWFRFFILTVVCSTVNGRVARVSRCLDNIRVLRL